MNESKVISYDFIPDPWTPSANSYVDVSAANAGFTGDSGSGDVSFVVAGGEIMRLCASGEVKIRGEIVDDNKAVYRAFLEWLGKARGMDGG